MVVLRTEKQAHWHGSILTAFEGETYPLLSLILYVESFLFWKLLLQRNLCFLHAVITMSAFQETWMDGLAFAYLFNGGSFFAGVMAMLMIFTLTRINTKEALWIPEQQNLPL
ncbi:hypothetical protein AM629_16405 [Photorhabdus heterorhabditis]|uniref:Uncharacterized protein n=1 Tax=Photorhabdus heterorhabditis TaxID=880156 RepID=A0ABR5KAB0_9GAMM|nr:hypothetical protein AM629_16405 [Photorhabdus heterorhabditis]